MKLLLLIIGILLTITSSQNSQKEINVKNIQTERSGTYSLYGVFASNDKGMVTIKDMGRNDTITAYGCTYCNDYGKAIIEKKGSSYTIKNFKSASEFKQVAKVLEVDDTFTKAKLQIADNEPFWTNASIQKNRGKAFFITDKWVVQ